MIAMLARAIQYLLTFFGLLFVGVALYDIRIRAADAASGGFIQSIETHLKVPLFLFLGFLALLGAYRIRRGRRKKSDRHTFSHDKG